MTEATGGIVRPGEPPLIRFVDVEADRCFIPRTGVSPGRGLELAKLAVDMLGPGGDEESRARFAAALAAGRIQVRRSDG